MLRNLYPIGPFARWLLVGIALLLLSSQVSANPESAEVRLGPLYVMTVHGGLGSADTEERAARISRNILELAKNPIISPDEIVVSESEAGTTIDCRGQTIMLVTAFDAKMEKLSRGLVAARWAGAMRQVVQRYRTENRQYLSRSESWLRLILATFGVLLLSRGLRRLRRYRPWRGWDVHARPASPRRISGFFLNLLVVGLQVGLTLLYLATGAGYLIYVLGLFPETVGASYQLIYWIAAPVRLFALQFREYIPNLFVIALILLMARFVTSFLMVIFLELEDGTLAIQGFYSDWARPTYNLCKALVILATLIAIFPYIPGSDSRAFQGMSILLGVLVSLSSSSLVGNLISGIILIYTRAFRTGDFVEAAGMTGQILDRQLLATRLLTPKNVVVTIPNASLMAGPIRNFTEMAKGPGVAVGISLTLGYDVPWREVHRLLVESALATPQIKPDPAPFVVQTSLNDFHITYELHAYTDQPQSLYRLPGELHQRIQDRFSEARIEILSPSYIATRDGQPTKVPGICVEPEETRSAADF